VIFPSGKAAVFGMKPDMRKYEAKYAEGLDDDLASELILRWDYRPVTLRLPENIRYTPTFRVVLLDGSIEYHEVRSGKIPSNVLDNFHECPKYHPYTFRLCNFAESRRPQVYANSVFSGNTLRLDTIPINETERRYANRLEADRLRGLIVRWDYEPETMKLAHDTRYTPDYRAVLSSGHIEFHECKGGFIREDAKIKFKIAACVQPYIFRMCIYKRKQWDISEAANKHGR